MQSNDIDAVAFIRFPTSGIESIQRKQQCTRRYRRPNGQSSIDDASGMRPYRVMRNSTATVYSETVALGHPVLQQQHVDSMAYYEKD